MSTIIERGAPPAHAPTTDTTHAPGFTSRVRAIAHNALAAITGFGDGLARSFEASRQAAHVTERYLRMTNESLIGHGLTRRDVERRLRDIKCRDV